MNIPTKFDTFTPRPLDRETAPVHTLVVKATEECHQRPAEVSTFDPSDDSLLELVVRVNDLNDNSPEFTQSVFTGGISTDIDFGTAFMQVQIITNGQGPLPTKKNFAELC